MSKIVNIVTPDTVTFTNTLPVTAETEEAWNTGLNIAADKDGIVDHEIKDGIVKRNVINIPLHGTNQVLPVAPGSSVSLTVNDPKAVAHYMNLSIEGVTVACASSTVTETVADTSEDIPQTENQDNPPENEEGDKAVV